MITKSKLAIELSKLKTFENPKIREEQYVTDSEIAADMLWFVYMQGDIYGKIIADFGCGTGILGIGALLLGAKKVFFIEKDSGALLLCKENAKQFSKQSVFKIEDIKNFNEKTDTVIQNPPFGTKTKHADREFLEKAFKTANVVYSFHKSSTREFVEAFAEANGFKTTAFIEYAMPLKATLAFHRRRIHRIKVGCWRFQAV